MVKVDDRDLYQMLMSEFRYSVKRDNHLAPGICFDLIKAYLPQMEKSWRAHTANQLSHEIIEERLWAINLKAPLEYDSMWDSVLVFLTNYLESLPYNTDRYMDLLFNNSEYTAVIDYYSVEMQDKIKANWAKN